MNYNTSFIYEIKLIERVKLFKLTNKKAQKLVGFIVRTM